MQVFKLKDYDTKDTIVAVSTYPAKSALAVIRISGKKSIYILSKIFVSKSIKNFSNLESHKLYYGFIVDKRSKNKFIDEVLVVLMKKPNSYTKEDVVEISCHGSILVINKIIELACRYGARLALPGEFTYRAFLNGRLDLLQAKSVADIVDAKTEEALEIAIRQLKGEASKEILEIKEKLTELYSHTEAFINFPDEEIDLDLKDLKNKILKIKKQISLIIKASEESKKYQDGINCVICGKTNVGKSTLFNCLLKQERVITSPIAGTTRDLVSETINLDGLILKISDTAGILSADDEISKSAIKKTLEAFKESDLILLVLDASRPLEEDDYFFFNKILTEEFSQKKIVLVINKIDLNQNLTLPENFCRFAPIVKVSALKNIGIDKLKNVIKKITYKKGIECKQTFLLNNYQIEIFKNVENSLAKAIDFIEKNYTIDFVNLALKDALQFLGKFTGEILTEDILENIFSNFCIGK